MPTYNCDIFRHSRIPTKAFHLNLYHWCSPQKIGQLTLDFSIFIEIRLTSNATLLIEKN